jgi:hypothetical protein
MNPAQACIRTPDDLLAVVPYALGFHPTDSLVVLAIGGQRLTFIARLDLPDSDDASPRTALEDLGRVVLEQDITEVVLLGYGAEPAATTAVDTAIDVFADLAVPVLDALRITGERYFGLHCTDPECCPPEGNPVTTTSPLAAQAVLAGMVALPDHDTFVAQLDPQTGPAATAMQEAVDRAADRLAALFDGASDGDADSRMDRVQRILTDEGVAAVDHARERYRTDGRPTDDEAAHLLLALVVVSVRDHAWAHTDGDDTHLRMWTDLTRRAPEDLAAAPASLLAFAAWRQGRGSLAEVAVSRALEVDPEYRLARLMAHILRRGLPPSTVDGWPRLPTDPD